MYIILLPKKFCIINFGMLCTASLNKVEYYIQLVFFEL